MSNSKQNTFPKALNSQNKTKVTTEEITDEFNKYFSSKANASTKSIP